MGESKIKEDYKKTSIGVIPKDWEMKKLGEIGTVINGLTYSPDDIRDKGTLVLRSSNVQNGALSFDDNVYVDTGDLKFNPVKKNDILICVRNGSKSLIGKNTLIPKSIEGVAFGAFMSVYRSKSNNYLFQFFGTDEYQRQIHRNLGATINSINNNELKEFKLPIPPLAEQTAIADCLSTWDSGIEKLSALITAKKEQKKGLMQQLLTGKKRLDGFTKKWEFKKISKVAKIIGGGTPSTIKNEYWDGDINWFTPTEIKTKFVNESRRKITKSGLKNSSAKILPSGTILLTTRATIGEASIAKIECSTNQGFQSIVCIEGKANVLFFYDLIRYNKKEFLRKANGSTFLEISKKEVEKIKLKIPSFEEQTAIAEVLTTADKEIELLEQKLASFKMQKKGLMQVLLTGEKRLIK